MSTERFELIAPCHFGLEAVLKREILDLGYEISKVEDGKVTFLADAQGIADANVFLRTTERILLKVAEVKAAFDAAGLAGYEALVGWVNEEESFIYGDMRISMEDALHAWTATLEKVFPTHVTENKDEVKTGLYKADSIYVCKNKVAKPTVFIPVFPGTNC